MCFFVIKCTLKLIIITKYIPCHLLVQNPDKEEQIDIKVKKISYQSEAHSQLRYQFEAHSVKVMIRGSLTVKVLVWGSLIVKVPIWVKYSCQNMCVFKFPSCKAARLCSAPGHSEVLVSGRGVPTPVIAVPGVFVSGDSYGWVCGAFIVKVHGGAIVAKQVRLLQQCELIEIVGYVKKKQQNKQTNKQKHQSSEQ